MKNLFLKVKNIAFKVQDKLDDIYFKISYALMAGQAMAMSTMPVYAGETGGSVSIKNNLDIGATVGGILGVVMQMAFYVGLTMVVSGAFTWILAYQSDDSERQSRAVKVLIVGGILTSFRALLTTAGIING